MKTRTLGMVAALAGILWGAEPTVRLPPQATEIDLSAAEGIAVLSDGRIKPMVVAATEGIQQIRGRAGFTARLGPMRSWFALAFFPDSMAVQKIVFCANKPLRQEIGLDPDGQFASFAELTENAKLRRLVEIASAKERQKEKPTALEKSAREVARRLERFAEATSGSNWRIVPGTSGAPLLWRAPQEVGVDQVRESPVVASTVDGFRDLATAYLRGNQAEFDRAAASLSANPALEPGSNPNGSTRSRISAELILVKYRPFRIAWILLMSGFLAAWIAQSAKGTPKAERIWTRVSAGSGIAALALLVAGFALRVFVSGRAPVTNMYETTLWVGLGVVVFGFPISLIYRSRIVLAAVSAAGWIVFLLADNLPSVLDPSIHPLVPVLRNNFWLTLHVLTVTISYAAFLVAVSIGNVGIFQVFRKDSEELQKTLAHYAHRAMQLGVMLLTAGIILGGVWADYSWGRFWGWDPKETWSLIADLGYLMVLHARFTGWVKTFGTLMGAVLGFFGVVMAWYGVNFVLASGLHSYGFSEGGTLAIGLFVVAQGGFALACHLKRRRTAETA